MAPKKEVKEKKVLLGRPGNNLKSGIVGIFAAPRRTGEANPRRRSASPTSASPRSSKPSQNAPSATRPTSPTPPSTLRRRASSSPTSASTGSARTTSPSPRCRPT
jgi:hypothetical protein